MSLEANSTWNTSMMLLSSIWYMSDFPLSEDELHIAKVDMNISNQPRLSITTPTTAYNNTNNSPTDTPTNKVDIMYLSQCSNHIQTKLISFAFTNGYPENIIFHFEGFNKLNKLFHHTLGITTPLAVCMA
jgi:hypothetical protein